MLHVRVVTPPDRREAVVSMLLDHAAVCNIVTVPGAAQRPDGDLVQFDVAREAGNELIRALRDFGLEHDGSLAIERIDTAISDTAARAEATTPGDPSEAVIWEEVEAKVRDESSLSVSFVVLLSIAVMIAAVGIMVDAPILVVGAMVVGPEYGALSSMALGLHQRHARRFRRGALAIVVGFPVATLFALALGIVSRATGLTPDAYVDGDHPQTAFISHPDSFTVIVAVLAAIAGTISLTQAKYGTLVGVLVSVTTIPAASNVGVALAHGNGDEAWGAALQLVVNLAAIVIVGAATLRLQWWALRRHRRR